MQFDPKESSVKDQARIVIIGAGIVGCATAYYLTRMGWRDIVVVEQGPLFEAGGSTSHAPGLLFQVNASKMMSTFAMQTEEMYSSLELDGEPCWLPVGGMEVAWTRERLEDLKRKVGFAQSWGIETHVIGPDEAREKLPLLSERIYGAMYTPGEGIAKAVRAGEAMARESQDGAEFYGDTAVTGIDVRNGRVRAVLTSKGDISTDTVLAAAGIWGPRIGRMAGVAIPLQPMQHLYAVTEPLPELEGATEEATHPVLRHQDRAMYFRQWDDAYAIGSYQHEPMLTDPDDILSHADADEMPSMTPWTPHHFEKALVSAGELLPALKGVGLARKVNGMLSFTPDGFPVVGESPEVEGFWSAQAVWITHAGGVARAVAEWLVEGDTSMDMREADISRFHRHQLSRSYIRARGAQQYREVYDIIHPLQQMAHPRGLRLTPFHRRQEELGAVFFENAGWERPQWYESNAVLPAPDFPPRSGWEAQHWSPIIGAEHQATRERVALFDMTPFTKLEVTGPGALDYLQRITSNQMDRPVGSITYTSMLDERGGIKCDLTITRLAQQRFLVVTGGGTGPMDTAWMRRHLPKDGTATMDDVSGSYCCIGVWGPRARDLVAAVTDDDVSNEGSPYMTSREISVAEVPLLALRISYVGELGWEMYAPAEYGLKLWDTLWEAGRSLGVAAVGGGAFDSLRLEKGYRLWGNDIHTEYNPYEAGLGFAVRLRKGDFIGREALLDARKQGIQRKLCCMTLDDPTRVLMGKETIFAGGRCVGYVTSANYGYTAGKSIAYGYLPAELAETGAGVEIEYFGERYEATVSDEPLFDPNMERLKS